MHRQIVAAFLLSVLLLAPLARAGEVERWNRIATDAALAEQIDPLSESRIFAIVQAAIHDALNAVERRYEPYKPGAAAAPGALPETAVAGAAHTTLSALIPARKPAFDAALAETLERANDRQAAFAGLKAGRQAATVVLAARRDDGANRVVSRAPGTKSGEYRPTPPDFTPAFGTQWGALRPFVLTASSQFRPVPPLGVKSIAARADVDEVRAVGGKQSSVRTAEQSEIARFWYESSPQGWNRIARVVTADRDLGEWESARLFALVNLALADGYIAGFEAKYHFNYWRPATAIRDMEGAKGDADWLSYLDTPPLPDYPSNHTVEGAAAATVMARFFGTDFVSFTTTSGEPYAGITRRFWSFSEAARENGASRVFAGIHFSTAVRAGYAQGEQIGAWTYDWALRPVRAD